MGSALKVHPSNLALHSIDYMQTTSLGRTSAIRDFSHVEIDLWGFRLLLLRLQEKDNFFFFG